MKITTEEMFMMVKSEAWFWAGSCLLRVMGARMVGGPVSKGRGQGWWEGLQARTEKC